MNEDFIRRYCSDVCSVLRKVDPGPIVAAISALYAAWKAGKPVLFCGNGGSGSSCSHIVNDLQKNVGIETGKPLKALCLSDAVPLVSAWANDSSWSDVFAPQVATWGESGGVLVAVSGSGNSDNVIRASLEAEKQAMTVIALTGLNSLNALKNFTDRQRRTGHISIHVSAESMQQAEDTHMVILHMLYLGLVERIKEASGG